MRDPQWPAASKCPVLSLTAFRALTRVLILLLNAAEEKDHKCKQTLVGALILFWALLWQSVFDPLKSTSQLANVMNRRCPG